MLEPAQAVAVIERALRRIVVEVDPNWLDVLSIESREELERKSAEDRKRRDGWVSSYQLIEYTDFHQLTRIILKRWEVFKAVFGDHARTKVLFGIAEDYRNPSAHSRELLDFEAELLSGSARQIRNQVAIFLGTSASVSRYYPTIDSAVDHFGRQSTTQYEKQFGSDRPRVDVGHVFTVRVSALPARGRVCRWKIGPSPTFMASYIGYEAEWLIGNDLELRYEISEKDVSESTNIGILLSSDSKYHRHGDYDDVGYFPLSISPPDIE